MITIIDYIKWFNEMRNWEHSKDFSSLTISRITRSHLCQWVSRIDEFIKKRFYRCQLRWYYIEFYFDSVKKHENQFWIDIEIMIIIIKKMNQRYEEHAWMWWSCYLDKMMKLFQMKEHKINKILIIKYNWCMTRDVGISQSWIYNRW